MIFSRETFRYGTYAVVVLHKAGRFFDALPTRPTFLKSLATATKTTRTIIAFILSSSACGYDKFQVLEMVKTYGKLRSSNLYYAQLPGCQSPLQPSPLNYIQNVHSAHSDVQTENTETHHGHVQNDPTAQAISHGTLTPSGVRTHLRFAFYPTRDISKKATSVATYFEDMTFTGSKEQYIPYTVRNIPFCADQFTIRKNSA